MVKEYARKSEKMVETTSEKAAAEVIIENEALMNSSSRVPPEVTDCGSSKRRKVSSPIYSYNNDGSGNGNEISSGNSVSLPATTATNSVHEPVTPSKCSGNSVTDSLKNIDLKHEDFVTDNDNNSSGSVNIRFSGETVPLSEHCGHSVTEMMELSSLATAKERTLEAAESRRKVDGGKIMPSAEEIEEFFSASEKYVQKRFAEKYNYDIVNDVAMEGRYQWVRI